MKKTEADHVLKLNESRQLVYCHTCRRHLFHPDLEKHSLEWKRILDGVKAKHASHDMAIYSETIRRVFLERYQVTVKTIDGKISVTDSGYPEMQV